MILLLFGPPGCGKGTQARYIAAACGIPAISTGEMFRAECQAGTELGQRINAILASGGLVSDETVNQVVASRLSKPDCRAGFLLDGYPRTVAQADFLATFLKQKALPAPVVIHIDVAESALIERLCARRQCPHCGRIYNLLHQAPRQDGRCDDDGFELARRKDDCEDVIRQRLQAYDKQSAPLIGYYASGEYHRVDGNRTPEQISAEIEARLTGQWVR
jgi:adenylate kinase